MQEQIETRNDEPAEGQPRSQRFTLMLTQSELDDAKLVSALLKKPMGVLLREWAMKDIVAEAEATRARLVEVAASDTDPVAESQQALAS